MIKTKNDSTTKPEIIWYALPVVTGLSAGILALAIVLSFLFSPTAGYIVAALGIYIFTAYATAIVWLAHRNVNMWAETVSVLADSGSASVLDVGCGTGRMAVELAKGIGAANIIGIDIWDIGEIPGNSPQAAFNRAVENGVQERVRFISRRRTQ